MILATTTQTAPWPYVLTVALVLGALVLLAGRAVR